MHRVFFGSLLGLTLLWSAFADAIAEAAEPTPAPSTVLVCGKLFDGTADELAGLMEILIADGKIAQIGPKVERRAVRWSLTCPITRFCPASSTCTFT